MIVSTETLNPQKQYPSQQEIFNIVVKQFAKQNWQISANDYEFDIICKYRSQGCQCAIGALIPDLIANESDNLNINLSSYEYHKSSLHQYLTNTYGSDNYFFLEELQKCHDNSSALYLKANTKYFAQTHKL